MPYRTPDPIFVYGINGGSKVFLPEPRQGKEPTHWLMTDACVAYVTCSMCGAKPMEFCLFDSGKRGVTTHWVRRRAGGKIPDHMRLVRTKQPFPDEDDPSAEEHW